eukprot:gene5735-10989_t
MLKGRNIDPEDVSQYVPLEKVYFGVAASSTLQEMIGARRQDMETFKNDCRNFMIESLKQIKARFDVSSEIHDVVECLQPKNAASLQPLSLRLVTKILPYVKDISNTSDLDREWREHALERNISGNMTWSDYWLEIKGAKKADGSKKCPTLIKFVGLIATFPFSNAPVERVFSALKLIKSNRRGSLKTASLVSLMQSRFSLKMNGSSSSEFEATKDMLDLLEKMKANATDSEASLEETISL